MMTLQTQKKNLAVIFKDPYTQMSVNIFPGKERKFKYIF